MRSPKPCRTCGTPFIPIRDDAVNCVAHRDHRDWTPKVQPEPPQRVLPNPDRP